MALEDNLETELNMQDVFANIGKTEIEKNVETAKEGAVEDEKITEDIDMSKAFEEAEDIEKTTENTEVISIFDLLKDKELISFEKEELSGLSEEDKIELLTEKYEASVQERAEEIIEELPENVKDIIRFTAKGGSIEEYLKTYLSTTESEIDLNMDINDEKNQEKIIRFSLKKDDWDEEEIESRIENLKDKGTLKDVAEKRFNIIRDKQRGEQKELLKRQEIIKQENIHKFKEEKKKLTARVEGTEDLEGMKLSKIDKKEIPNYILDRNVKYENGTVSTRLHADLWEVMSDEKAVIQLAQLLRTRKKDGTFDFSLIKNNIKTEVTKEMKEKLASSKSGLPKGAEVKTVERKNILNLL
ncbi:MAG: hypothetical protein ACRC0V_07200 [Fusobacteriaceae bacterium]|uniref:hypothetical protein n=1 Tax=Romboutsia sp. TaxID=1965302 RepID=UPI003F407BCE